MFDTSGFWGTPNTYHPLLWLSHPSQKRWVALVNYCLKLERPLDMPLQRKKLSTSMFGFNRVITSHCSVQQNRCKSPVCSHHSAHIGQLVLYTATVTAGIFTAPSHHRSYSNGRQMGEFFSAKHKTPREKNIQTLQKLLRKIHRNLNLDSN